MKNNTTNIEHPSQPLNHPIERIMDDAFLKMRRLTDADTIVGQTITTPDGMNIIPISRISMGIVTGGGEYAMASDEDDSYPFAGASGAGMTVNPVCFLVSDGKSIKVVNVNRDTTFDKALSLIPDIIGKIFIKKKVKK